jgi:hypothetical protein
MEIGGKSMKRSSTLGSLIATAVITVSLVGGAGTAVQAAPSNAAASTAAISSAAVGADLSKANGRQCPRAITGTAGTAPSKKSPLGVAGTTTQDVAQFAVAVNAIRVANCLPPIPLANFRYDSCMEARLFWMAESPSLDPMDAWGHMGSKRIDGVPSPGCDGNLAGGFNNTAATVAQKWWTSTSHRASLYRPTITTSTARVCILFAMTHGGVPNEPYEFARAAARWVSC